LVAATASYVQAKAMNGRWLLRIEDIDPPREQPGATEAILQALEYYEFQWDSDVVFQSNSAAAHEEALQGLLERKLAYPCSCSRRDLAAVRRGPLGTIYPGTCRDGCRAADTAIRLRTTDAPIAFVDGLQGGQMQRLETESGDFIIRRRDGLIAYHLAVVVDDALQGITEIVRGIDLMDSTPRQIWLQQLLGYRTPNYVHIPVITHANGDKFSKLTGARAIPMDGAARVLFAALVALQQAPPQGLQTAPLAEIWGWAIDNWQLQALQGKTSVPTDSRELATLGPGIW
jgi:glutamyl-Q tRNA(Asp) synthetase